ncbi:MAG TPA: DNA polymerase IV [Gammaproteobacteria bacterium]|nr:DNA polymerase IV [Gammaproteobacteria bacterium]
MESPPSPQRWIAHMDLDAFFASCEQQEQPAYRGRPVIVGALPGHRGVVAAASYEARRFGVHSAMPISEASRRCPDAVFLRPDMAKYREMSQRVFRVLESITPVLEAASIDEAYLDVSGLEKLLGAPATIGREIKRRILAATGLTASVGIGPNRLIAKLGSEHNKPDGLAVIPPDQGLDFLAPMPVSNLRGLGRQTQKIFNRLKIRTVAQLRAVPLQQLEKHLGTRAALSFHRQAFGLASDRVCPGRARKSISKETTFASDVRDRAVLQRTLLRLCADVAATARREKLSGSVVTLKIRFEGFETRTRRHKRSTPTHDERDILETAWRLFLNGRLPDKPVRLIGVGISDWAAQETAQADLFAPAEARRNPQRVLQTIDAVSEKFGKGMLQVGIPGKRNP